MGLLALGINHTTASLEVREKVAFSLEQLHLALEEALGQLAIDEIAILSTCNRSEIYCHGNDDISTSVLHWLATFHGLEPSQLEDCHYCYHDEEAIMHMMRVATGLDSMVLGEPQILGQLKSAYATAQACQSLGSELELLFQHTFSVAKQARTDTAIGENPVSVAYAAVSLAEQIFANISENRALLIGAGKTIELVAQHLQRAGVTQLTVANRTLERANELAAKLGAQAILLADIPEHLAQADIVISSTASQLPILGKGSVEKALKQRKHRPIFMVDIAVPRDIEVEVAELNDIYLYSVDDLKSVIDDSLKSRQNAAEDAEKIILQGCQSFLQKRRERDALGALRQYRQQAEALRDQELAKAIRKLEAGTTPEEAMALLARNLTNKLIHPPSVAMKKASADGNHTLLNWAKNLLGLKDHPEKATTD